MTRDFAFFVDTSLPAGDLIRAVKAADKINIINVHIFDVFEGRDVPPGRKSLAVEVTLQPSEKSYTDEDFLAITARIFEAGKKVGAVLRTQGSLNVTEDADTLQASGTVT